MKKSLVGLLLLVGLAVSAQKKLQLSSTLQAGLLEGERGTAFQLKTVNGVGYKTWAAGIGVGIDYYYSRSLPLFLELRKSFGAAQKAPFVYIDGGANFPWMKAAEKEGNFKKATPGLYYDAGIGYQIPVLKSSLLFFSAGYSQKAFAATYSGYAYPYPTFIDFAPVPVQDYRNNYTLRRISIQTGLRF